jgi:hypothetical protein
MISVASRLRALRAWTSRGLIACALAVLAPASGAAGADLHRLWDERCADCHGHAGDLARRHPVLIDGTLKGRSIERDLHQFLANHYPGDADVDDIHAMLLAQAGSEPRFREQCGGCHGPAADLARTALLRRDDVLYARTSNRRLDLFLLAHKGLGEPEVPFFVHLLEHVEREIHRP